ncbi:MAG: DUF2442 domain-containing protein [Proteobacteria bacterium]|nr:DUF2442 domain-containing protein [Pseudomonadota bacterium]
MHYITQAQYIKDYQIAVTFNDNKQGIIDLQNTIAKDKRAIFQELRDKKKFTKFKVDMDTIVWENGLDLAPEFIYEMLK